MDKIRTLPTLLAAVAFSALSQDQARSSEQFSAQTTRVLVAWFQQLQPLPGEAPLTEIQDDYSEFFVDQPSGPFYEDNFTEITPDFTDFSPPLPDPPTEEYRQGPLSPGGSVLNVPDLQQPSIAEIYARIHAARV